MTDEVLEHLFEPFFTRRRAGRAPAWACRSPTASSPTTAVASKSTATGRDAGRSSASALPLAEQYKEHDHRYQAA